MLAQFSILNLVACAIYVGAAFAALGAGREARIRRQQPWHLRAWVMVAVLFVFLIVSRLLGLEESLRAELRDFLETRDMVADRRAIQGPIIAGVIALFVAAAMFAVHWVSQRISGRRNIALASALGACGVMAATIAMRTVSLHSLDRLLYGPLKLNWVGDIGSSLAVLAAAIIYVRILKGKWQPRR